MTITTTTKNNNKNLELYSAFQDTQGGFTITTIQSTKRQGKKNKQAKDFIMPTLTIKNRNSEVLTNFYKQNNFNYHIYMQKSTNPNPNQVPLHTGTGSQELGISVVLVKM